MGAFTGRDLAFATWARAGYRTVLVNGFSPARYDHVVDEYLPLDPRDGSCDLDAVIAHAGPVDGVVTLSDQCQTAAAAVAERLGLPGPGVAAARLSRSKARQREACRRAGMVVPEWSAVTGPADIAAFFAGRDRRAVFKPADAAASEAVTEVSDVQGALGAWELVTRSSPTGTGVLEEFVEGSEVSVEAVVQDGEVVRFAVTLKESGGPTGFLEMGHTVTREVPEDVVARARRGLDDVLRVWRPGSCVVHAEFKVDHEPAVLVEAAMRPAGDLIPDLVARVWGWSLYDLQARVALGQALPPDCPGVAAHAEVRFLARSGEVRRQVPPVEILGSLPDVRMVNQLAPPGMRVPVAVANGARAGYALGWGQNRVRLHAQLGDAVDRLGDLMGLDP